MRHVAVFPLFTYLFVLAGCGEPGGLTISDVCTQALDPSITISCENNQNAGEDAEDRGGDPEDPPTVARSCEPGSYALAGAWTNTLTGKSETSAFVAQSDGIGWRFSADLPHGAVLEEVRITIQPNDGPAPITDPALRVHETSVVTGGTAIVGQGLDNPDAPEYGQKHDLVAETDAPVDRKTNFYSVEFAAPIADDAGASSIVVFGPPRATWGCP